MDDMQAMKTEFRQRFRDVDQKLLQVDGRFDRVDSRLDALTALLLQQTRWIIGLLISLFLGFLASQAGIFWKLVQLAEKVQG